MIEIPEFIKLKAGYNFPFYIHVPCVRFKSDRKYTAAMAVVEIGDDNDKTDTYLGEGFTSRIPKDRNDHSVGNGIAYSRAIIDALKQHINTLSNKENK